MAITFDSEKKIFKLDTNGSSYVFGLNCDGQLIHYYYGAPIEEYDLGYLSERWGIGGNYPRPHYAAGTTFSHDTQPFEYSTFGVGDYRPTALRIKSESGHPTTLMHYVSHKIYKGKPDVEGMPETFAAEDEATTLEVLTSDPVTGVETTLFYTVFEKLAVMTRHAVIANKSDKCVNIESAYSTCLDLQGDYDFIHLYGRPVYERNYERERLGHTITTVSSLRGASSHFHNPFVALASPDATEEHGEVYGFNLVYSGNFAATAYKDSFDGVRFVMGINHEDFNWLLEPGEKFVAPEAVMVYSAEGLGGMSRTFHKLYRNNLCRGEWKLKRRPILINNWEATYFNFDEEKLFDIAKTASELGIEMLVMDDGWFGDRNSDRSALGDWFVNEEKLKGGLGKLVERVNGLGLKFGIWFEPEMVSRDSELFRAHPEWALQTPGRPMSIARHQYVLDMARADVRDYLFDCIKKVMDSANIAYIKWDFNRSLTEVGSATVGSERQAEVFHRYVLGLYELLERLLTAYPHLLLEGCASGGGRFDPAWLYYSPQFWTSDDTDAIERLEIQYGTSMCYPTSAVGAHVSACPNHQTARISPLKTRGNVAMAGTFGYELDLTKLTDEEKEIVKAQCDEYRKYYDVINYGELYRLISPWKDRTRCAWSYVSEDKREALVTYVVMRSSIYDLHYIRLKGLDPNKTYRCEELDLTCSGALLMNAGINMTKIAPWEYQSAKLHFVAVD